MTAGRKVGRAVAIVLAVLGVLLLGCDAIAVAAEPPITIEQPVGGSSTNNQTLSVSGTTEDAVDPVTLNIHAGASAEGHLVQTLTMLLAPLGGSWELTPRPALEPGQYTAVAEQTNAVPETFLSLPVTFSVDATPSVSINTVPTPTKDAEPTLSGGAEVEYGDEPSVTVTIHEGASLSGRVAASKSVLVSGGAWSYPAPHLADGIYTAQAEQSDDAGNVGTSAEVTFTVDANAPVVTLTAPSDGAVVKGSEPTLSGGGGAASWDEPSVTVTIHEGASLSGRVAASKSVSVSGGTWSYPAPHLADGIYTAQASQEDEAGNRGTSAAVTFTVDANAPVVTLTAPSDGAVLKGSEPTLSGGGGAASWDEPSVTVTIHEGASLSGRVAASKSVLVSGGHGRIRRRILPTVSTRRRLNSLTMRATSARVLK